MLKPVNAAELDDLHFRMRCAEKLIDAVHTAMTEGGCAPEEYVDALFGADLYLLSLVDELESLCHEEEGDR